MFADDAAAALGDRRGNRVWQGLMGRAGAPTLRVSERLMTVAPVIAAHDKRIQDESWRLLEVGRKELLLPEHQRAKDLPRTPSCRGRRPH